MKLNKHIKITALAVATSAAMASTSVSADLLKRSFCILTHRSQWPAVQCHEVCKAGKHEVGIDLDMKAYTDEKIAAEDFKAGQV